MTKKLNTNGYTDEQLKFLKQLVYTGIEWRELATLFNDKFNTSRTFKALQNKYYNIKDFDFSDDEMLKNIRATHQAKKNRSKTAKENKVILDHLEEQESFLSLLDAILSTYPVSIHKPLKLKKQNKKVDRTIFAHLSDTHFHANIESGEMAGINRYGQVEEARRLAFFFKQVMEYKLDKRETTDLVLALNGDLMQGIIHDQESTPPMTTQFAATLHLLSQGISFLAQSFNSVKVVCTTGNHARFMHKGNKARQSKQKWDGFHTMLHVALRQTLKPHTNIIFDMPESPYALVGIQGHNFMVTHGDTVFSTGNVGKSIATESIKNKINDFNSGLDKDIDVIVMGHVHIPTFQTLNNGCELVINGSLSGLDEFAQSIGLNKNIPTQQMFEVTPKFAVGDMRFVRVSGADKMKELDSIIEPFKGKF